MKLFRKLAKPIVLAITLILLLSGCAAQGSAKIETLDDIHGMRVGVMTGSISEQVYFNSLPDNEIFYFNSFTDSVAALINNKLDCVIADDITIAPIMAENPGLAYIDESLLDQQIAAVFRKDDERAAMLRDQYNEFLAKLSADNELETLRNKWVDNYETIEIDRSGITGENGKILIGSAFDSAPLCFIKDNQPSGLEVELIYGFCTEYGYEPEFQTMDFGALIPSVTTHKTDMAVDCIAITDERKQSVNFSEPYTVSGEYVVYYTGNSSGSFIENIATSFKKTFIIENRWILIVRGLATTIAISIISAIFGTIIGYFIYLLCRNKNNTVPKIFDFLSWIVSSLPAVVFLMVMFYIIFGNSNISGLIVSIIAFSFSVSLSVYSALSTAVKSIDKGQLEGAYSLGFTDSQTFRKVILPQSMGQFLPNYKGILISLVQSTSIVGYIAVEDLTKVSDIIRSRTYEAFFPIIVSALIYLLICWLLTLLISAIEFKITPQKRSSDTILRRFNK